MKNTRFYDISCVILVILTLGLGSILAYVYLMDKYYSPKLQKLAVRFGNIYSSLFLGLILTFLISSEFMLVLWMIAMIGVYIYSIVQILVVIIDVPKEIKPKELVENIRPNKPLFIIHEKIKELERKNFNLQDQNLYLQKQLNSKETTSQHPHKQEDEYRKLLLKHNELVKRFEDLQNGIIERHDQRVEQWKLDNERELEDAKLNDSSFLRDMGYQITGTSREQRWRVLQRAVAKHGLKKVVRIIDGNIALRVRQTNGRSKYSYAIAEWNHDLGRLKRTYYKGEFNWPSMK
ncbi:hypothetical protein JOD03_001760 [Chryseomicrobium aureum]|uniref:hypothetical protein n=1 Tax=Chryseomicrobium aureum TaxID=1441723 RepID=UPI00195EF02A|nr:hypothetical protein [Chryseomicrobium aureum]MBM7706855.1 hypothetical protein [Chryseomicrobium aureum]